MSIIILERIQHRIETSLQRHQAGFRKNRSCIDYINTLRIIFEQCAEFRSPLKTLFVDFEKAFDRVHRDRIWNSLQQRGIPPKIIAIIKESYNNTCCRVLHEGQLSDAFEVREGVRQGCILSPVLFLLVIDDIMVSTVGTNEQFGIQWNLFHRLSHLDYADDICLLAHKDSDLLGITEALKRNAQTAGLKVNAAKTKDDAQYTCI